VNVVVVSNRVARANDGEPIAGGLAAALLPAVKNYGAVWVGSSGRVRELTEKDAFAEVEALGKGALATVDFPKAHYCGYYEGFANSALWPMLHSRADLIATNAEQYACYRSINSYMARALLRFDQPNSVYWIQDYHFLPLGAELRRLGIASPIGLFLHTPWPAASTVRALPHNDEVVRAMLAYDLIGFQTEEDQRNFADYVRNELGLLVMTDGIQSEGRVCKLATFPIGIDVQDFAARSARAVTLPEVTRLRASLSGKLIIGVDRVDYSKGLPNRMRAYDRLLAGNASFKRTVSMLQIAVPSRGQIPAYNQLQQELASLVGEVNGRHGEVDWTPIRYLNKGFGQAVIAGFYRAADIALVTPLHDGMNLVAKEYVAAQDPADPGVLVLSGFAGAAKELEAALQVNPYDIDDLLQKLATALAMPRAERLARWTVMMERLRSASLHSWFGGFVAALTQPNMSALPVRTRAIPLPAPQFSSRVATRQ
jgi:trehalose 6-phosphate synthase